MRKCNLMYSVLAEEIIMDPFHIEYRTLKVEHSCRHGNEKEPDHHSHLDRCIADVIKATEGMHFNGTIKSPSNSYQINLNFDSTWIGKMNTVGWKNKQIPTFEEISEIPNIKPDAFLTQDGTSVIFEIEKSNKKTIWFDFIKILMFIGQNNTDFGIIIVPRNYAHKIGVWDLFKDARYYRSCLERFANVDTNLLSKIAIIGYTQEVYINENWVPLDSSIFSAV